MMSTVVVVVIVVVAVVVVVAVAVVVVVVVVGVAGVVFMGDWSRLWLVIGLLVTSLST